MTTIANSLLFDFNKNQTVLRVFRQAAAFSRIFNVHYPVNLTVQNLTVSSGVALSTYAYQDPGWTLSSLFSNNYFPNVQEVEFDVAQSDWVWWMYTGFSQSYPFNALLVVDNSGKPSVVTGVNGGSPYTTQWVGYSGQIPTNAHIKINVQMIQFGDQTVSPWIIFSIYCNNILVITWAVVNTWDISSNTSLMYPGKRVAGPTTTFSNVTFNQLCEVVQDFTIDPGENPLAGLQRATDGYYYRMWMRATNELGITREKLPRSSVYTISEDQVLSKKYVADMRLAMSRIRQIGAYVEANISAGSLNFYAFNQINNPFLLDFPSTYREGLNQLAIAQNEAFPVWDITIQACPLLELFDHVTYNSAEWIIDGILNVTISAGVFTQELRLRKYLELT